MAAEARSSPHRHSVLVGVLETLFVVVVAAALVGSAVGSVLYAEWLADMHSTAWAAAFGLLAGTALAFSSFPRPTAHLAGAIYGLFCIAVIGGMRPDIAPIDDWRERVFLMLDKLTAWAREAIANGASRETLPFVLLMAALFWMLGYLAGWYSFRRLRIWVVLLPPGATLFVNVYYYAGARSMAPFVALYVVAAVLLLALSHAAEREAEWRRAQVRVAASLRPGFALSGLLMAAVAMLAAWQAATVMSSGAVQNWFLRMTEPYQEAMARVNRLFSTLQNPISRPVDSYESSFELGGPRTLTEEPVMDVRAAPARYYWRARSYDAYDGRTWSSTLVTEIDLPPNAATLPLTPYLARVPAPAQFNLYRGTDAVYAPSQPIQVGVPARAVIDNERGSTVELAHLTLPVMLLPGNRYDAIGSMSSARVNDLRRAGEAYPAWVGRYLQIPAALPQRVRDLASVVTADARTPYEKAAAVERWLRTNIAYDEALVQPPPGREAADYVLFDTRRAYCNYYATAMVMMLRSQGIPARVVVGYAQGEAVIDPNDPNSAIWRVRQRDSHAWVEVFFPKYGWVEFEPTASQPEIPRREDPEEGAATEPPPTPTPVPPTPQPDELQATATPDPAGAPTPTSTAPAEGGLAPPPSSPPADAATTAPTVSEAVAAALQRLWNSGLLWLLAIPLAALAAIGGLRLAESFGLWRLPVVERSYGMLMRWAGWLGVHGRGRTPYERLEALRRRAPDAGPAAQHITERYVERRFGPRRASGERPAVEEEAQQRTTWRDLRRKLIRSFFDHRRRGARP